MYYMLVLQQLDHCPESRMPSGMDTHSTGRMGAIPQAQQAGEILIHPRGEIATTILAYWFVRYVVSYFRYYHLDH